MIYEIPKVNLGVGEMGFIYCDLYIIFIYCDLYVSLK